MTDIIAPRWIRDGRLRPMDPKTLFFMMRAATQHYRDFAHQFAALNDGMPSSEAAFEVSKAQLIAMVLAGWRWRRRRSTRDLRSVISYIAGHRLRAN